MGVAFGGEGGRAWRRGARRVMPEREVAKRALPACVQRACPLNTRSGQCVRCLIKPAPNRLPGEVPALQVRLPERLFHLGEQWKAPEAGGASPVANGPKVVTHYSGTGVAGTNLGEQAQGSTTSGDLGDLGSDGLRDGYDQGG